MDPDVLVIFFLNRQRLLLLMIFSRVWSLWFVLLQPHMVLWLLKSPSRIKGVGSCCNMLLISLSFMASWGGIYREQILIVLCKVTLTAIAWS